MKGEVSCGGFGGRSSLTSLSTPLELLGKGGGRHGKQRSAYYQQRAEKTLITNLINNRGVIKHFNSFIEESEKTYLKMLLVHKQTGHLLHVKQKLMTRWSGRYKKRVLARLYKLEKWFQDTKPNYTFITFTTYQNMPLHTQYEFIKINFQKMKDVMRKRLEKRGEKLQYVWVTEPMETGYTHIHMLCFNIFNEQEIKDFKTLWAEKYKAGVKEAFHFSTDFGGKIRSVKNYLMKYIGKSLNKESHASIRLYNAVAWDLSRRSNVQSTGFRFYGMSHGLSKVCKLDFATKEYKCLIAAFEKDNKSSIFYNVNDFELHLSTYNYFRQCEDLNNIFAV